MRVTISIAFVTLLYLINYSIEFSINNHYIDHIKHQREVEVLTAAVPDGNGKQLEETLPEKTLPTLSERSPETIPYGASQLETTLYPVTSEEQRLIDAEFERCRKYYFPYTIRNLGNISNTHDAHG